MLMPPSGSTTGRCRDATRVSLYRPVAPCSKTSRARTARTAASQGHVTGAAHGRRRHSRRVRSDDVPRIVAVRHHRDGRGGALDGDDAAHERFFIGPYEITGWLGVGGMWEVYRARDPRLRREVAIKLLPERFASDASRLRRFEQEARAVGQLNHPNILSVYDVRRDAGTPFVVCELLEGETLRARLRRSALAPRQASEVRAPVAATTRGSSIGTSSPRTCSSPTTDASRSWTSASRS